ncbi:MAG: glycosyltransferase [Algoriphagus sp.]|uniref:glycosyltransferase n=1 Tax=Algoriphagus sp. TaxID=1872435 RepID=UPI0017F513D9|nr:glycosyltransferase [Algoriphagus sp.]NVJ85989.1 glycosyltransferase [Algoriphagus sp.]
MKIIHVVPSIDLSSGGPSKSVTDLSIHQALKGEKVSILTAASSNPYLKESSISNFSLVFTKKENLRKKLLEFLNRNEIDMLHGHGIWQMPVHWMAKASKKKNIPYIISPRGMLEPWALNVGKLKKKLALALYQRKDLAKAACIHATAKMEAENIRKLGFTNPIAVIPNGIDLAEFPLKTSGEKYGTKTLLFLSRIHPKKGIELLVEAWSQLDPKIKSGWKIELAGNGEKNYIQAIQKLIQRKGLESEITIIGPQFGQAKLEAYHRADLFLLPTYSENFGIVIAEALACGVPVITTKGTPWEELNELQAGWWIDIGTNSLKEALENALSLSDEERKEMGLKGRKLIEEKYSIEVVARQMIQLYQWILGGQEKPEFVL